MLGAAWLAGRAALHAGAGRVYVGQLDPQAPAVDPLYPELMLRPAAQLLSSGLPLSALVAGPGMGLTAPSVELLALAIGAPLPLLLDADALNLLAMRADLRHRMLQRAAHGERPAVITPHAGEAARLLGITAEQVQADRLAAAHGLVERYAAVVVLKGAGTLVAWRSPGDPDASMAVNPTGNNRLATAGSGDVLSGLIGALLARGLDAPTAAQLGAWVHGRAGERLPDERPTASGLLPQIATVFAAL